jgi:hypothetical protein
MIELERSGQAMKIAQEQELDRLRQEAEKAEKALRDSKAAKSRGA